jgi:hypothetical protein
MVKAENILPLSLRIKPVGAGSPQPERSWPFVRCWFIVLVPAVIVVQRGHLFALLMAPQPPPLSGPFS